MSRILIKNLPPSVSITEFKKHFSTISPSSSSSSHQPQTLTITDAKLPFKKDGTFRRFGFVGYKTPAEASRAQEWFSGTYFGSCKVIVEIVADGLKSASERPSKRRRLDEVDSKNGTVSQLQDSKKTPFTKEDSPELKEFLEVMRPRRRDLPAWANDDMPLPTIASKEEHKQQKGKSGEVKEQPENVSLDAPVSDLDWLNSKKAVLRPDAEPTEVVFRDPESESDAEPEIEKESKPAEPAPPVSEAAQTILSTSRLFVRNLTFSVTSDELDELFAPFGQLEQIHIPLSPQRTPKGLAYVTFKRPTDAVKAFEELDGRTFQGRLLHILPAIARNSRPEEDSRGKQSVKAKQLDTKKKLVQKERGWEWGVLYMNSDAVASSVADRFGISKSDILHEDGEDGVSSGINPAVKLALAETHVIEETRNYLASQGIHLSAFSPDEASTSKTRPLKSDTTILVKNIPYGTTESTLKEMFIAHGELVRLVVPPSGTIAVVDFAEPIGAETAIKTLSYRRLGNSVMYLERAPLGIWSNKGPTGAKEPMTTEVARSHIQPVTIQDKLPQETEQDISAGTTLFVKNLAFSTTSEGLSRTFRNLPSFSYARVATKPDPKRTASAEGRLSMGFGFVGFTTVDAAKSALKGMNGFVLDGHKLVVNFAGRGTDVNADANDEVKGIEKSKTTKMIVKNVPFEVSKKDIRQLFSAHGQLKSVRVPKRFDSRSRGFAFLEFVTRREAEQAYAALRHTHLLGRHLVLEWAEDGAQDIDKLREKVGVGFGQGKDLPGKKRKLQMEAFDGASGEE